MKTNYFWIPPCFVAGDIEVQVERLEKVFGLTEGER